MKFFTTEQLGEKQSLTPEGFLLCLDVPIARTGVMIYGPDEVPITPNKDGIVRVVREEEDVFAPQYLASLNGKSVVIRHPEEDVNPSNWKDYTIGVVLNPRRGTGTQTDLLIADLLITDAEGIALIRDKKLIEVSCGYQADYDETDIGEGRQYNFIANHVALVEAGRCGSRCSIADHQTVEGDAEMKRTHDKAHPVRRNKIHDAILTAWKAKDEEGMTAALDDLSEMTGDEEPGSGEHMHIHIPGTTDSKFKDEDHEAHMQRTTDLESRMAELEGKLGKTGDAEETEEEKAAKQKAEDAEAEEEKKKAEDAEAERELEGAMKDEVPEGLEKKAATANDSAYLADSFQDTISMAEILMPGIQIPTFDKKATPKATFDSICKLRRKALDYFGATGEGRAMVEQINGKTPDLPRMSCGAVRTLFRAAAVMRKNANLSGAHRVGDITVAGRQVTGSKIKSLSDLNKANRERFTKS